MTFRRQQKPDERLFIGLIREEYNAAYWTDPEYWTICQGKLTPRLAMQLDEGSLRKEGDEYIGEFVRDETRVQLRIKLTDEREDGYRRTHCRVVLLAGDPRVQREARNSILRSTFFF